MEFHDEKMGLLVAGVKCARIRSHVTGADRDQTEHQRQTVQFDDRESNKRGFNNLS